MITHYCLTYGKIPSGPVSWERCVLKTTPVKAKILCAVAIQIEKEGGRGLLEKKREYLEDLGFRKDLLSHGPGPGVKCVVMLKNRR